MLRRNWRTIFILIAIAFDSVAIGVSGISAYVLRELLPNVPDVPTFGLVNVALLAWGVLFSWASILGLYRATYHTNVRKQYVLAWKAFVYSIPTFFSILYILQWSNFPRRFTFLFFLLLPIAFVFFRILLNRLNKAMQQKGYGVWSTLVFGFDNGSRKELEQIAGIPELGYQIRAFVTRDETINEPSVTVMDRVIPKIQFRILPNLLEQIRIDRILIPSTHYATNGSSVLIDLCARHKIELKMVSPESETLLRFSYIHDVAGMPIYSPPKLRTQKLKRFAKRIFDLVAGGTLVLLLSPLFLVIAVAIVLEDGFPVLFNQRRGLAKGKNEFEFFKFRSMVKKAEERQHDLYQKNETTGGLFLMRDDPRVTRVGRILRRFSLDELPQLFNVLLGDMSLVGPRPLSIADLENITSENSMEGFYTLRSIAKPGMTGLWQISGRREISFREMVLLDLYYIDNQSIMLDVEILFATIPVVLFGKGAY